MSPLWKVYLAILLVTVSEGGMNTIYPPFLHTERYAVDQIGLIVALFGVLQLAARLPAGTLYGAGMAKALFATFVLLFVVSTAGFAYSGGTLYLLALTMLHGFAFGAIGTVMLAWIIELKPERSSHGASMGWYTAALSAGYSIGNFSGGYLADRWGYALAFIIIGLVPLFSILLSLSLPAPSAQAQLSRESRHPEAAPSLGRLAQLRTMVTRNLVLATLIAFYLNVLDDGFAAFFPLFGLGVGLNLTFIGFLKSVKSLTATGLRPMSGLIFRHVNLTTLNNLLIVSWALVMVLLPSLSQAWAFLLVFVAIGACRGLLRVTTATMIAEEKASDSRSIGLASGVYNAGLDAGAFAGPLVAGYVASLTDIATMFRVIPLAMLGVYFLAAFSLRRAPFPSRQPQDAGQSS